MRDRGLLFQLIENGTIYILYYLQGKIKKFKNENVKFKSAKNGTTQIRINKNKNENMMGKSRYTFKFLPFQSTENDYWPLCIFKVNACSSFVCFPENLN